MKLDIVGVERVIKYVREQYGAKPEYLWAKAPTFNIFFSHKLFH